VKCKYYNRSLLLEIRISPSEPRRRWDFFKKILGCKFCAAGENFPLIFGTLGGKSVIISPHFRDPGGKSVIISHPFSGPWVGNNLFPAHFRDPGWEVRKAVPRILWVGKKEPLVKLNGEKDDFLPKFWTFLCEPRSKKPPGYH